MLLLSVQVRSGGDEARVRVDAEELVAGARQQTVPDDGVLLWKRINKPLINFKQSVLLSEDDKLQMLMLPVSVIVDYFV